MDEFNVIIIDVFNCTFSLFALSGDGFAPAYTI